MVSLGVVPSLSRFYSQSPACRRIRFDIGREGELCLIGLRSVKCRLSSNPHPQTAEFPTTTPTSTDALVAFSAQQLSCVPPATLARRDLTHVWLPIQVVQALLGLLVILSLVYKRHRESPKRPWEIWVFDVAKQLAGQMFVHGVNLLISGVVAQIASGNACVLYFLNILIDTTLGARSLHTLSFRREANNV
jgi:hypothetical protein